MSLAERLGEIDVALRKKCTGVQQETACVNAIQQGTITVTDYRSLIGMEYLSMDEKTILIRKILENSRLEIHDVIDVQATLGPAPGRSSEQISLESLPIAAWSDAVTCLELEKIQTIVQSSGDAMVVSMVLQHLPDSPVRDVSIMLWNELLQLQEPAMLDTEKIMIFAQSLGFLHDYGQSLLSGGFEGSTVTQTAPLLELLCENQRKLAHQTIVDRHNITSADHGMRHLIQSNLAITEVLSTALARVGRITPQQRVFLRQVVVDHDVGYALTLLANYGCVEGLTKPSKGYYDLLDDHPLFSRIAFDANRDNMAALFGPEGFEAIRTPILDHEHVRHSLLARDHRLVQAVFSRADCMGVAADIKMMQLFDHQQVMAEMGRAFQLKLWMDALSEQEEQRSLVQEMLQATKTNILAILVASTQASPPIAAAYRSAVERYFDPDNPSFIDYTATKNFGSYCLSFRGIQGLDDLLTFTAVYEITPMFSLLKQYFSKSGAPQADAIRTDGIVRLLQDFGYTVPDTTTLAAYIDTAPVRFCITTDQLQIDNIIEPVSSVTKERFLFIKTDTLEHGSRIEQWVQTLEREIALKETWECACDESQPKSKIIENLRYLTNLCSDSYQFQEKGLSHVIKEVRKFLKNRERKKAADLLLQFWLQGYDTSPSSLS